MEALQEQYSNRIQELRSTCQTLFDIATAATKSSSNSSSSSSSLSSSSIPNNFKELIMKQVNDLITDIARLKHTTDSSGKIDDDNDNNSTITHASSQDSLPVSVFDLVPELRNTVVAFLESSSNTKQENVNEELACHQAQTYLKMTMEQLDGSVTTLLLALHGELTDRTSSSLFAACGQAIENLLIDFINQAKACNSETSGLNPEQKENLTRMTEATFTTVSAVSATLRFVARIVLDENTRNQLLTTILSAQTALEQLQPNKGLANFETTCSPSNLASLLEATADLKTRIMWILIAVQLAEKECISVTAYAAALSADPRLKLRTESRALFAAIMQLISSTHSVVLELPELQELRDAKVETTSLFSSMMEASAEAASDKNNDVKHLNLVRRSAPTIQAVQNLATIASQAVPVIKARFGPESTVNLEKRIMDVGNVIARCTSFSGSVSTGGT